MCSSRVKTSMRDPGILLAEQIQMLLGDMAAVKLKNEKPWASITFSGTRHAICIEADSRNDFHELTRMLERLPRHEFDIPGRFVADLIVASRSDTGAVIEALTIIDPVEDRS